MILALLDEETIALFLTGLQFTVALTVITTLLSLGIGILMGTLRLSRKRWHRRLSGFFIELHRNVPALVLILFWAFAVPNLFPPELRQQIFFDNWFLNNLKSMTGLPLVYYGVAAALALTLNTSAYIAELYRAGARTIPQEHVDAARTLGATTWGVYRRILLPQGLATALPAISSRLIHNMKNTSLAAFVSVPELFHSMQTGITRSFKALEFLLLAAILYLLLSFLFSQALRWIESKVSWQAEQPA